MKYEAFAKIIKEKRMELGYTQKEFAKEIPLNISIYNKIENGNQEPSFQILQRICILLELDLTEILEIKKPRGEHKPMFD